MCQVWACEIPKMKSIILGWAFWACDIAGGGLGWSWGLELVLLVVWGKTPEP